MTEEVLPHLGARARSPLCCTSWPHLPYARQGDRAEEAPGHHTSCPRPLLQDGSSRIGRSSRLVRLVADHHVKTQRIFSQRNSSGLPTVGRLWCKSPRIPRQPDHFGPVQRHAVVKDSLLTDVCSTVPPEELSRLRHAPLPKSLATFPLVHFDTALSKMLAALNDALIHKALHRPRIPNRYVASGPGQIYISHG